MFNKTSIFNRSDAAVAREPSGRAAVPATEPSAARGPSPVPGAANGTAKTGPEPGLVTTPVPPLSSARPALPAAGSVPEQAVVGAAEKALGSRLIVGPDVKLKGAEILDCDTLVVEGRVEATMDSRVIRIAENGSFSGKVSIDIAEIHGTFEGDLTARAQLIIHSTGRVNGTIRYGKLVADEGCVLCGDINILTAGGGASARPRETVSPESVTAGRVDGA